MDSKANYDMVFVYDIECITMLSTKQYQNFASLFSESSDRKLFKFFELFRRILLSIGFDSWRNDYRLDNIGDEVRKKSDNSIDLDAAIEIWPMIKTLRLLYDGVSIGFNEKKQTISNELIARCGMKQIEAIAACQGALDYQNLHYEGWNQARKCLKLVNERSNSSSGKKYANVIITEDEVLHGTAQLLVAGFSPEVPIGNVYSTAAESKESTFKRIQKKFGEKCILVSITSNENTSSIAKKMNIPVWHAGRVYSLKNLYNVQHDFLLREQADFNKALFKFLNA